MSEVLEDMLLKRGVNPTAMRLLVMDYLLKKSSAVSLQDLENDFQYSDRITLYRTLNTFEGKGVVHKISTGLEAVKFALCSERCGAGEHYDLHLHFYCANCKETSCLPKVKLPDISFPNKFIVEELNLTAKGICDRCSSKQCN